MAVKVENAFIAHSIDGGVYFNAPVGTTVPTDSTTALNGAFADHGALAEDGLAVGITRSSSDIKDFDGGIFIDIQEEYNGTIKLTFLESDNINVIQTLFGDNKVEVTPATATKGKEVTIHHSPDPLPIKSHVCQVKSGVKRKRYVIEKGRVAEIAEIKDQFKDVTRHEVTIKAFRNSAGNYMEEYRNDGKPVTEHTVTITGTPTGGNWTLTVDGQTTGPLAHNASASAVKTALEALSTVETNSATVTGANGGPYTITLANGGTLTASGSGLTGGTSPSVGVS
ncbi:major tail protein [Gordonia phage Wrigley]|nr:major tail protein [Gordonia phage Wrigley]